MMDGSGKIKWTPGERERGGLFCYWPEQRWFVLADARDMCSFFCALHLFHVYRVPPFLGGASPGANVNAIMYSALLETRLLRAWKPAEVQSIVIAPSFPMSLTCSNSSSKEVPR